MAKVAILPACIVEMPPRYETSKKQNCDLFIFLFFFFLLFLLFMSQTLFHDDVVLIVDTTVRLAKTNCTYSVA